MIFWCDCLIYAHSRTLTPLSLSSPETEYYGQCGTAAEVIYIGGLLGELGYETTLHLFTDSSSGRAMAMRQGLGRARHIDLKYLWLQDVIAKKRLDISYTPGPSNVADLGTKHWQNET